MLKLPIIVAGADTHEEGYALININNVLCIEPATGSRDEATGGSVIHFVDGKCRMESPMSVEEIDSLISRGNSYTVDISQEELPWAI